MITEANARSCDSTPTAAFLASPLWTCQGRVDRRGRVGQILCSVILGVTAMVSSATPVAGQQPGDTSVAGPLTMAIVTPYVALDTALAAFWKAHSDQWEKQTYEKEHISVLRFGRKFPMINYEAAAAEEPSIATLFAQHHLTPARYAQTQLQVQDAISAVMKHSVPDTTTSFGKDQQFVQAQHTLLAHDWTEVQRMQDFANTLQQAIFNFGNSIKQTLQGGGASSPDQGSTNP